MEFLTPALCRRIARQHGTPVFVYSEARLKANCAQLLEFPHGRVAGFRVRYAMKANSNAALLRIVADAGLHVDASSGWECSRAMLAGIPGPRISISSQEFPADMPKLHAAGVQFNACSLTQLRRFGELCGSQNCSQQEIPVPVGLRFNPGVGSGANFKTNVGGPSSSFGIWHKRLPEARRIAREHNLRVVRIHTHIGSGSDPRVWVEATRETLRLVKEFPEVRVVNLGGGFKVQRMPGRPQVDLELIGRLVQDQFEEFQAREGRPLELEIEPGTWVVANAGALLARIQDRVDTLDCEDEDDDVCGGDDGNDCGAQECVSGSVSGSVGEHVSEPQDEQKDYNEAAQSQQQSHDHQQSQQQPQLESPSLSQPPRKKQGYRFLKLDCGMTEILRPTMYGAQHQMTVVPAVDAEGDQEQSGSPQHNDDSVDNNHNNSDSHSNNINSGPNNDDSDHLEYVVVGHCCESGDLLTPADGEPDVLEPRRLGVREARIGDLIVVDFCGAYCSSMSAKNYNSFPEAAEVLVCDSEHNSMARDAQEEPQVKLIRRRQTLEQILVNECYE